MGEDSLALQRLDARQSGGGVGGAPPSQRRGKEGMGEGLCERGDGGGSNQNVK